MNQIFWKLQDQIRNGYSASNIHACTCANICTLIHSGYTIQSEGSQEKLLVHGRACSWEGGYKQLVSDLAELCLHANKPPSQANSPAMCPR